MATPYEKIYEVFMRHVNDIDLLYPKDNEFESEFEERLHNVCLELFKSAVVHYFSPYSSLERNDTIETFTNDLRPVETEIIGLYMLREYYRQQLNFLASLKDSFSDKDFKSHEKANKMNQYRQMLKELQEEIDFLIVNNSFSNDTGKYNDWLNETT